MRIHIVSLLPLFLHLTQQEMVTPTLLDGVPFVTLPLIGFVIAFAFALTQEDTAHIVTVSLALFLIPIVIAVAIDGGGILDLVGRITFALFGTSIP